MVWSIKSLTLHLSYPVCA